MQQLKEQYDAATWFPLPFSKVNFKISSSPPPPFFHIPPFPYVICLQELNLKKTRQLSELCGLIKVDLQYLCIYACFTSCKQIFSDRCIFNLFFCARVISVKSIDKSDALLFLVIIIYFSFLFCFVLFCIYQQLSYIDNAAQFIVTLRMAFYTTTVNGKLISKRCTKIAKGLVFRLVLIFHISKNTCLDIQTRVFGNQLAKECNT